MASAKEIPPGGEGKIDVTFKSGSRAGKRQKSITVTTNDPEQKTTTLKVSTDVEIILATAPSRINFGRITKGSDPVVKYVSLSGKAKDSVKITSVKVDNEFIKCEVNPQGFENKKDKKIKITVLPGIKVGRFRNPIIVTTDNEKIKELKLHVYGEMLGNITVKPTYLSFGILKKGDKIEKTIKLTATSDVVFKVLDVSSTIPELETKLETVTEGKEYKVTALIKETFDKKLLKGKIIIKTDDQEQQNLEVKVFGRIPPPPKKNKAVKKSGLKKDDVAPVKIMSDKQKQ